MNKNRILIVEDEYIVAMDIRNILQFKLGYEVVGMIRTGEEAIEAARNLSPDLILMDIILDGKMTGIEAATIIKQKFNLPVIYLTAFSDKNTLASAKMTEPYGYILKPLDEHVLHSTIEMALFKANAERIITENEERYRLLVENSPVAIGVHCEGNIVYVNPAGVKLFGAGTAGELIGQPMMKFIHNDSRKAVNSKVDHIHTKGMSVEGITEKLLRVDGKIIDVETAAIPTKYNDKPAIEVVIRDITELKKRDRIQKSLLQILQVLNLQTSPAEFFGLFSSTLKEFIPLSAVIVGFYNTNTGQIKLLFNQHENDKALISGLIEHTIKQNSTVFLDTQLIDDVFKSEENYRYSKRIIHWIGVPLVYDEDNIGIIAGINSDPEAYFGPPEENLFELFAFSVSKAVINLIREAEQNKAFAYLENLNSAKDKFFSSVTHELKNNFNALLGYTDILKNSYDALSTADIHSSIDSLYTSSRTIYNLIEKLLRFSRYASESYKPNLKIISLGEVLEKELSSIKIFSDKKNILLHKYIEQNIKIYCDEEIITSIFQDFMIQTIRYSNNGSKLEISARDNSSHIEVAVTDKGTGIEDYLLKNLFITKDSKEIDSAEPEKGIGFLLTREIMRRCGCELIIENSPGRGSSFRLLIPASKKQKIQPLV